MIKEINSSEVKKYLEENTNAEILDVRTPGEWKTTGRPDGKKIGTKTHFVTIVRDAGGKVDLSFIDKVKEKIDVKKKLLVICRSGSRSALASHLLSKENYECINIIDGYEGNGISPGWIGENLPYYFDNEE